MTSLHNFRMPIPQPITIDVVEDYGAAEGYVVDSDREQLPNWLQHRHHIEDAKLLEELRANYGTFAFLNNLNVEPDQRNSGYGRELFDAFRSRAAAEGANAMLVIADTAEGNPFDLVDWYRRIGFETLVDTGSGPLMMLQL